MLYGKAYLEGTPILQFAVWYDTFGYYRSVRNVWILAEEKQRCLAKINVTSSLTNVALNFLLIPILGGVGAAIASIITQLLFDIAIGFVYKPIRRNNYLMLKGLNPKILIGIASSALAMKRKSKRS